MRAERARRLTDASNFLLDCRDETEDRLPRTLPHRGVASVLAVRAVDCRTRNESFALCPGFVREPHQCLFWDGCSRVAVALVVFMRIENARLGIGRRWLPVLAVLLVGVSLALPLFLYMREARLEQLKPLGNTPTPA